MQKHKLFMVAVVSHPTEDEYEDGKRSELVVEPMWRLAASEQEAQILAARMIPENLVGRLEHVEVVVAPF